MQQLKSFKPYLFTAYYNWFVDSGVTPHLLVNAALPGVDVPKAYVRNGSIILSIAPAAISDFAVTQRGIAFKAMFKGQSEDIYIPYIAMEQLIAVENGMALPLSQAMAALDAGSTDDLMSDDEGADDVGFSFDDGSNPAASSDDDKKSSEEDGESSLGFEFVEDDKPSK